ncbi:hypothetical protein BJF79_35205 [Actinomadura sp. CNU-125]|uniref:DUF892 family protein n=1 Tax=Actinomadura sp. CNU-125 TaxID=1904961 RepID=UPI0009644E71|nr:DUF892 family protein [Actinomadura sp. CNU-125]OLT33102.1 hypothetical protein BJF79_35205 [Actinomadura sp. CNU-125]
MTTIEKKLVDYLKDAHALQQHVQGVLSELLTTAADEPDLCRRLGEYARRNREHTRAIEERLRVHRASPSIVRDAEMLWGAIADALRYRNHIGRHVRDGYVSAHLQIAEAEMLRRIAARAGDRETADIARAVCDDAHALSEAISDNWDVAVELSLRRHGVHQHH